MNVRQAIDIAKEWLDSESNHISGFVGAHLLGSINSLPLDAPFPRHRDMDIRIIRHADSKEADTDNSTAFYRGLILDLNFREPDDYISPINSLSNPGLAHALAFPTILADPSGLVAQAHRLVKREYANPRWVIARCDFEKELVLATVETPNISALQLSFGVMYLGGLVTVAHLQDPTHRRSLILLKHFLEQHNETELHEEALSILGSLHISLKQATSFIPDIAEFFQKAVSVYQTPIPHVGYKLREHYQPYYDAASQEMIDEGHHREAMQWILHAFILTNTVIQNDAPENEKPCFQKKFDYLLDELGLTTSEERRIRQEHLRRYSEKLFRFTDKLVASNSAI